MGYISLSLGAEYIGVHCLGGKKPPLEIKQAGITNPNLPYPEISQYTLTVYAVHFLQNGIHVSVRNDQSLFSTFYWI